MFGLLSFLVVMCVLLPPPPPPLGGAASPKKKKQERERRQPHHFASSRFAGREGGAYPCVVEVALESSNLSPDFPFRECLFLIWPRNFVAKAARDRIQEASNLCPCPCAFSWKQRQHLCPHGVARRCSGVRRKKSSFSNSLRVRSPF